MWYFFHLQSAGINVQHVQLQDSSSNNGTFSFPSNAGGQGHSQIIQIPPGISQQALLNTLQAAVAPGQRIIVQSIPSNSPATGATQLVQAPPPPPAPVTTPTATSAGAATTNGVPVQIGIPGPDGQITYQTVNIPWSVLHSASGPSGAVNVVPATNTVTVTSTGSPAKLTKAAAAAAAEAKDAGNNVLTTVSTNQLTPILIQHNGQLVQAYNVTNAVKSGNFSLSNGGGTIQVWPFFFGTC